MALTQVIVFAVLQGLTAILPIAGATHFSLLDTITGWPGESALLALAGDVGVLLAVAAYFWRDLFDMGWGVMRAAKGKRDPGARLALQLAVASLPAIALMLFAERYLSDGFKTVGVMGWVSVAAALVLFLFDRMSMTVKRIEHATYVDVIVVSLCQVLALVPGASRAGVTMTMARFLGYERDEAVRLSMLLAIPFLAAVVIRDVVRAGPGSAAHLTNIDIFGAVVSFAVALITVAMLMAWLKRSTFTPLVVYRVLVASAVVVLAYGWIRI